MPTEKQKESYKRNHLIMRLRGAHALFAILAKSPNHNVSHLAQDINGKIDRILNNMGAETQAVRLWKIREKYSLKNMEQE